MILYILTDIIIECANSHDNAIYVTSALFTNEVFCDTFIVVVKSIIGMELWGYLPPRLLLISYQYLCN